MLRRLIVMRHAKSSWKSEASTDHDRPLNARGRRDAPRIARALMELDWAPTMVHLSDARRTRETWIHMSTVLTDCEMIADPHFYLSGLEAIQTAAANWSPRMSGPMLVLGHNPGWELAASILAQSRISMTTGNAVLLEGHGPTWVDALRSPWELKTILMPRALEDEPTG
ncbi:MAG: hypothetical protein CL927_02650 [Deltaproteobacteria bacterium]|nr:hypothetical protein [Deltaproteobacteria bacterium]HCH66698.1 hypothetical protein [Deltaproteobacteria bacterium]